MKITQTYTNIKASNKPNSSNQNKLLCALNSMPNPLKKIVIFDWLLGQLAPNVYFTDSLLSKIN